MKYWKKYLVFNKDINKLAKYDAGATHKLYYLLCDAGVVIPDMYCVVTESPEHISQCEQFEQLAEARQYKFMLALKQIQCSIVSKKTATKQYDQYIEVKQCIDKVEKYEQQIKENIESINEIHSDIKYTFDICSKEFATKHAQEQSYKIYQILNQTKDLEEFRQHNVNLLNNGSPYMCNKDNRLLSGIKL